jgi:hypothetical protein
VLYPIHLYVSCIVYICVCPLLYTFAYVLYPIVRLRISCILHVCMCPVYYTFACALYPVHSHVPCTLHICLCPASYKFSSYDVSYPFVCVLYLTHFRVFCILHIFVCLVSYNLHLHMSCVLPICLCPVSYTYPVSYTFSGILYHIHVRVSCIKYSRFSYNAIVAFLENTALWKNRVIETIGSIGIKGVRSREFGFTITNVIFL